MSYMKIAAGGAMVPVGIIVGYRVLYGANGSKVLTYRDSTTGKTRTSFPTFIMADRYAKNMKMGSNPVVTPVYSTDSGASQA